MDLRMFTVKIKGLQTYEDGSVIDKADVEIVADAKYANVEKGRRHCIEYEETEASGMSGTWTELQITKDYVTIERRGTVKTMMVFEKGKLSTTYYDTPYGQMVFSIMTDSIEVNMGEDGGTAKVRYSININNAFSGTNEFEVTVVRGY